MAFFFNRAVPCALAAVVAWAAFRPAAALADDGAQARAAAYQAQTREVLKHHHWRITFDQAGKLVGRHVLGPDGSDLGGAYAQPAGFARLTILFRPQSVTSTPSEASIVACYVESTTRDHKFVFADPVPFNNPDASRTVEELLSEARKQLVVAHPEYGSPRGR